MAGFPDLDAQFRQAAMHQAAQGFVAQVRVSDRQDRRTQPVIAILILLDKAPMAQRRQGAVQRSLVEA